MSICCSPLDAIESVLIAGAICEEESKDLFVLKGVLRNINAVKGLLPGEEKEEEQLPVESTALSGSLAIVPPPPVVVVVVVVANTAVAPAVDADADTDVSVDVVLPARADAAAAADVDVSVDTGKPRVTLDTCNGLPTPLSFSGHDTQGCTGTFS